MKRIILALISGQFIISGLLFLIAPFYNIFALLGTMPFWIGIPMLALAIWMFGKGVESEIRT